MIEGAIQAAIINAKRLMKDPANYDARAEIQWLASVAHNGILDTGRAADWGSHRIELKSALSMASLTAKEWQLFL